MPISQSTTITITTDNSRAKLGLTQAGAQVERLKHQVNKATGAMASRFKRLEGSIFNIRNAVAAVGAGVVLRHLTGVAATFEQMEIKLNALTKGRGKETLEEINAWALNMPVNTEKTVDSFVKMTAMGLDPAVAKLTTLVDVASLFGEEAMPRVARALGQMKTLGKLSAEELNQLSEAGINARKYLKEAFGMGVEEIQKSGMEIDRILEVIWQGLDRDFGGAARSAMSSWQGLTATFQSYVTEIEREVMAAGLFDAMKDSLSGVNAELSLWLETNKELIKLKVPEYLDNTKTAISETWDVIKDNHELLEYGLIGLAVYGRKGAAVTAGYKFFSDAIEKYVKTLQGQKEYLKQAQALQGEVVPFVGTHSYWPWNQKEEDAMVAGWGHGGGTNAAFGNVIDPSPTGTTTYDLDFGTYSTGSGSGELSSGTSTFARPDPAQDYTINSMSELDIFLTFDKRLEAVGKTSKKTFSEMSKDITMVQTISETVAGRLESGFTGAFDSLSRGVKDFGQIATDVLHDIMNEIMRLMVFKPLAQGIAGGITGLFDNPGTSPTNTDYSTLWNAPGRASGGPVSSGQTYLIGERGPELLHMGSSGHVSPNSSLGGSVVVNINNNAGAEVTATQTKTANGGVQLDVMIDRAAASGVSNFGETFKAIQNTFGLSPALARR